MVNNALTQKEEKWLKSRRELQKLYAATSILGFITSLTFIIFIFIVKDPNVVFGLLVLLFLAIASSSLMLFSDGRMFLKIISQKK